MKIVSDTHFLDHGRRPTGLVPARDSLLLDHIGGELRGLYGDVETVPLPDALSDLLALLDRDTDQDRAA